MRALLRKFRDHLFTGLARRSDLDALYDLISGLISVQNAMEGRPVLRPLRGWAISPDVMTWVLADLQERKTPVVIEFGSGQSTVILAAALKHRRGRLISVEHDADYAAAIQHQLASCGLTGQVQFLLAPMVEVDARSSCRSYDLSLLSEMTVDVALVDGPPLLNGALTRLTPLRWAANHLSPGGVIFVDDSAREAERACLRQLVSERPALRIVHRSAEKGLVELR